MRGQGVTHALIRAAVDLARHQGALAIEGWPAGSDRRLADGLLGRESVFAALGFSVVGRPSPRRAIMRLELDGTHRSQSQGD